MIYDLRFTIAEGVRATRSRRREEADAYRLSLAPGFSPVTRARKFGKPLKRFPSPLASHTGLKAGANKMKLVVRHGNP